MSNDGVGTSPQQPLEQLGRRLAVGPGFAVADRDLRCVGEAGFARGGAPVLLLLWAGLFLQEQTTAVGIGEMRHSFRIADLATTSR